MQVHVREQACLHTQTHVTRRPRTHRHIRKTTAHTGSRDKRSDPLSSDRVGGQRQAQEVVPGRHLSPVCSWDATVLRGRRACHRVAESRAGKALSLLSEDTSPPDTGSSRHPPPKTPTPGGAPASGSAC